MDNDTAIFRSHVYSENGNTPYRGSFTLLKELDGSFSHVCCFPEQNPNVVEYKGGAGGVGTQEIVFAAWTQIAILYRCVKVRSDFLDIRYMRTTAGRIPAQIG